MKYKVGDRFRGSNEDVIIEIVSINQGGMSPYHCRKLDGSHVNLHLFTGLWEYLGNFSKGNNFDDLYNKLNNGV